MKDGKVCGKPVHFGGLCSAHKSAASKITILAPPGSLQATTFAKDVTTRKFKVTDVKPCSSLAGQLMIGDQVLSLNDQRIPRNMSVEEFDDKVKILNNDRDTKVLIFRK